MRKNYFKRYSLLLLIVTGSLQLQAQWSTDPAVNTPVATGAGNQAKARSVSDGAGGVIIAYEDNASGTTIVKAQHLDATGQKLWGADGLAITTAATANQTNPDIISDGSGGAIIAWEDYRNASLSDIYLTHLISNGTVFPGLPADGINVSNSPTFDDVKPLLGPSINGDAYVFWKEIRGVEFFKYQMITQAGQEVYLGGVVAGTGAKFEYDFVPDATGGGHLISALLNGGPSGQNHINQGYLLYKSNNVTGDQNINPQLTSYFHLLQACGDAAGGVYYTYIAKLSTGNPLGCCNLIYRLVHLSSTAQVLLNKTIDFNVDPANLLQGESVNHRSALIPDGNGGVVVAWNSSGFGNTLAGIYTQHYAADGTETWNNGAPVTLTANGISPFNPDEINHGLSVVRSATGEYVYLYSQTTNKIDFSYVVQKLDGNTGLSTAPPYTIASSSGTKESPTLLLTGTGLIATWTDYRNGADADIYAHAVDLTTLPVKLTSFTANYANGKVNLKWQTAAETMNSGYFINRSTDNVNFSTIGQVAGNGSTKQASYYSFTDAALPSSSPYVYYQLRQVDTDGLIHDLGIVSVKVPVLEENLALTVYPNPASNVIRFKNPASTKSAYRIYDLSGKLIKHGEAAAQQQVEENVQSLSAGTYILELNVGNGRTVTSRFVVSGK